MVWLRGHLILGSMFRVIVFDFSVFLDPVDNSLHCFPRLRKSSGLELVSRVLQTTSNDGVSIIPTNSAMFQ